MGTTSLILVLTLMLFHRFGLFASLLFGYCAMSAVMISLCPLFPWYPLDERSQVYLKSSSSQSLLFMLIVILSILFTPKDLVTKWLDGFVIVGFLSAAIMIFKYCHHESMVYGILSNSAEDATYLGLIQPYIWRSRKWRVGLALTIPAILFARSSTGFALIALQLFCLCLSKRKHFFDKVFITCVSIVAVPVIGKTILGAKLLNNDGRFTIWQLTWEFFNKWVNPWTGLGAGSFYEVMPNVQVQHGLVANIFLWAHNEFLQTLFEYGIVGLVLLLCLYCHMLYKSRSVGWITVTLFSMFIGAFLQMPFRLMLTALFYAVICRLSLTVYSTNRDQ